MTKRKMVELFVETNRDKRYSSIEIGRRLGISTVWVRESRRLMRHDFNENHVESINDLIVYISQYIDGSRLIDDF